MTEKSERINQLRLKEFLHGHLNKAAFGAQADPETIQKIKSIVRQLLSQILPHEAEGSVDDHFSIGVGFDKEANNLSVKIAPLSEHGEEVMNGKIQNHRKFKY